MKIAELVTLPDLLHESVERHRTCRAVGEITYGELEASVCIRAHDLRSEHRAGTPVILDGPGGAEWIVEFFAILEAGLVAVPLLPNMDRACVARLVGESAVPAGTAMLVCTCASVKNPILVRLTHANLLADLRALRATRRLGPGDTMLSVLPPAHLELMAGMLGPFMCGARIAHQSVPLPRRILARIRDESACRVLLVPALFEMIVRALVDEEPASPPELAAKLRRHPDRRALRRKARARLGDAFNAFVVGGAAIHPAWTDIAWLLGFRLEVGYHGDPRATAAAIRDGWLRTGDHGRLDGEGNLFVDGRIKDAIVPSTGETFWPPEIEEHYDSALFADHCVAPRRARDGNDEAVLFVVPRTADHAALEREFRRLRRAAPARAYVKSMRIADGPFPRSAEGDVRRRELAHDREQELRLLIEEATGESLERFGPEDDLMDELAIDSLAALRVLAMVEHRFDVRIPDDRLGDFRCLARLLEAIELGKAAA